MIQASTPGHTFMNYATTTMSYGILTSRSFTMKTNQDTLKLRLFKFSLQKSDPEPITHKAT